MFILFNHYMEKAKNALKTVWTSSHVHLVNPDDETNLKRQIYNQFNNKNITNESDSSSEEDVKDHLLTFSIA
jgi:hypothetical protein